jgi:hypothetical protein
MFCVPILVNEGRDFGGLDFTATTPENIRVAHREAGFFKVAVDRGFECEDANTIRPVGHSHDVHIIEVRPPFAPVAMGEAFVSADL